MMSRAFALSEYYKDWGWSDMEFIRLQQLKKALHVRVLGMPELQNWERCRNKI